MAQVQGHCDPKFETVKKLLQENIESEAELGASIAVNINGTNVVDIWGGYADESRTRKWEKDTIVNVWSVTKTVTSLAALMCVDRGLLDVDAKVSKYWPEFAANGKQDVEIRHLFSHSSGLSGWDLPVTGEDTCDLEVSTAKLASQAPWWEPGTASAYHAQTFGHLLGEVVRRVSGKSLTRFVAEEIAGPLGADFQIGALEKDWPRIADIIPPPPFAGFDALPPDSIPVKTFTQPPLDAKFAGTETWRRAELGSVNGHGNARSISLVLSAISLGGKVNGITLLSPKTIDLIFKEQINGIDLAMGIPIVFGTGFGISGEKPPVEWLPSGRVCFWFGWGGSAVIMDPGRGLTISYAMNKMRSGILGSDLTESYVKAAFDALDKN